MIKKFLAFACCMAPLGAAVADPVIINPGNGNTYVDDGLIVPSDNYARIISGIGLGLGANGLSVGSLAIGQNSTSPDTPSGEVFVEVNGDVATNYTIRSDGNISITNALDVLTGHALGIGVKTASGTIGSVSIGSINATGALTMENVGTLDVTGNIVTQNALNLTANVMNVGGNINSSAGNTSVNVTNALGITGNFINQGNAVSEINVGSLSVSNMQNQAGTVTVVSNGAIASTGSFENSGTSMVLTGTDMTVGGTVKNDSNSGTMTLVLDSLRINGGSGSNASFVNSGNLGITVLGETYLKNGFDLSAMNATNTFSLHTGTLEMDGNDDSLSSVFENNKLTSFELVVINGSIDANNITNGSGNAAANMTLTVGGDITAESVQNNGNVLTVSTIENSEGDITISALSSGTRIYGANGSTTTINADGTLSVDDAISNAGTMVLNGNRIELAGVSNSGTSLTIEAQTDPTGSIYLSDGVTNSSGTTNISARQIQIDGVVATIGGTTNVYGSDANNGSLTIGGISAQGGVTNINALIHSITVDGDLLVSNGAFNVGADTQTLNVNGITQIGNNLTFSGTNATGAGNVNVANSGINRFVLTSNGQINVAGNVVAEDATIARTGQLISDVITIGGNVAVANSGRVIFGNVGSGTLDITGDVTANANVAGDKVGTVEIYSNATTLKSLSGSGRFIMHGNSVAATTGGIDIANGIWFDGTNPTAGMIINGTDELTLQTNANNQDVTVAGGVSMENAVGDPAEITLNIISERDVDVTGMVSVSGTLDENNPATSVLNVTAANGDIAFNGAVSATDGGSIVANGATVTTSAITIDEHSSASISGTANTDSVMTGGLVSNAGDLDVNGKEIQMTSLKSTGGTSDIIATNALQVNSVDVSGGIVKLQGTTIDSTEMSLSGGTTKLSSDTITVTNDIVVSTGNVSQGGTVGTLILNTNDGTLSASNLTVSNGMLVVDGGDVEYDIDNTATFANGIQTTNGTATVNANAIVVGGTIANAAALTLNTEGDLELGAIQNTGTLVLDTTNGTTDGTITVASLTNNGGNVQINSDDMTMTGALNASGILYQNYGDALGAGDINIIPTDYTLTTSNLIVHGIRQVGDSTMTVLTSDVDVTGNIVANDLRFVANPGGNWMDVNVIGNVSGGVDFVGLEHMYINGNYTYNDDSMLHAAVLPNPGVTINSTTYNYWSTVSLADDNTFGRITNATDGNAAPLISVNGNFIYDVTNVGAELSDTGLVNPQIGIDIFDMVDSGTAIWLLHANGADGLTELSDKIRNLYVNFCNADGTRCFKYFDNDIAANANANQTETNLPAYLTVRDINEDGITDSIYVVFDSRFGGPVEVFKIQPVVDRVADHTNGEHDAAGALDEMIAGGLQDAGFYNRTPIEAIPVAFQGTNLEQLADELYNRMEQYVLDRDGTALSRFSRLIQPREVEQVAGNIALNEHTNFRDFEDHMLDEFIWNRHRALRKAWLDVDYGLFYQNTSDGNRANGDRFSIVGGYDWQHTSTLILGFAGHIAHVSGDGADKIDLGYRPGETVDGDISVDVADTNIGLGAYLMKTLGTKARLYGNGFLDLHLIDISRDQNYVSHIDGSGSAFSLISEWGLLHDWLNQYIVGNLYARVGYNFGFSVKEKADGTEYMRMDSDGYMILTPGYSLIAQKRIYPSSWFQIRPYVSVGVEYDVLGAPDYANFKFGPAKSYSRYDIDIDPLWANIGGGVELLSATGFQLGMDYRYQYNNDIQLHKVRLSGSYRF